MNHSFHWPPQVRALWGIFALLLLLSLVAAPPRQAFVRRRFARRPDSRLRENGSQERRAGCCGLRDEAGGRGAFGIAEPLKLPRQGPIGETRLQRLGERLDRLAHAAGLCAGMRRGSRLAALQRNN